MRRGFLWLCLVFALILGCAPARAQILEDPRLNALSADGQIRVGLAPPNDVVFLDDRSGVEIDRWQVSKRVTALTVNRWGGIVYLGFGDGSVEAMDTRSLRRLWVRSLFNTPVTGLDRWGADLLAVDLDGSAVIVNAQSGETTDDSPGDLPERLRTAPIAVALYGEELRMALADGVALVCQRKQPMACTRTTPRGQGAPDEALVDWINTPPVGMRTVTRRVMAAPATREVCFDENGERVCRVVSVPTAFKTVAETQQLPGSSPEVAAGFPWPPPPPSDAHVIPGPQLAANGLATLADVDAQIRAALTSARYVAPRYYSVPGGFLVLTKLETIFPDGRPYPEQSRWDVNPPVPDPVDFWSMVQSFFSAPVGYYRVIAFAVAEQTQPDSGAAPLTPETANAFLNAGAFSLDGTLGAAPLDPARHELVVLIYEFEKPRKDEPASITRGPRLSAVTHLDNGA